jgi:hypothetical protein
MSSRSLAVALAVNMVRDDAKTLCDFVGIGIFPKIRRQALYVR